MGILLCRMDIGGLRGSHPMTKARDLTLLGPPSSVTLLLKKCKRRKKINNKWVEGTPNPDLLDDFLPVNQFQLYHVKYACV